MSCQVLEQLLTLSPQLRCLCRPDVRKHIGHGCELLGLSSLQRSHDLLPGLLAQVLLLLLAPMALALEQELRAADGLQARLCHALDLDPAAVSRSIVGGAVVPPAVGHHFHHDRFALEAELPRSLRRKVDGRQVVSVNADAVHAVRDATHCDPVASVLFLGWCGYRPAIIATQEDCLRLEGRRKVQGDGKVALGGRAVAEVRDATAWLPPDAEAVARTDRLRDLRAQGRRHRLHLQAGIAVVHRHLSALARLIAAAHALVHDLLDREATVHECAELAVLRPDDVRGAERSDGAHLRSLLAAARHVEGDAALALQRVHDLVHDADPHHGPVQAHRLLQRERQLRASDEPAVLGDEPQGGDGFARPAEGNAAGELHVLTEARKVRKGAPARGRARVARCGPRSSCRPGGAAERPGHSGIRDGGAEGPRVHEERTGAARGTAALMSAA
mmetsp:Transcript_38546/g.119035  ORF Transcript_38546/g.119035 Transcript_38546/m.119035 type:complete len:445 (+) Transcript_38546:513-1847(+)